MAVTLESMATAGKALRQASIDADRAMSASRPGESVFLEGVPDGPGEPYVARRLKSETYRSPISPAPVVRYLAEPQDDKATLVRTMKPKLAPPAPAGYIVPAAWTGVIDLLKAHGIRCEPAPREIAGEFTWTRFQNVQFAPSPFEGRFPVRAFETLETHREGRITAGSVWVPVAQPAGKLAMHILEPEAPDSAVRWGFFQSVFEQKEYFSDYVFVPYAEAMLAADAALKREYEEAVASDAALKSNARARLTWLYRRSPYQEPDKDIYPVLRLDARPW
jgi:hypothetical protein